MKDRVRIPAHWQWATFGEVATVASDLVDPTLTPEAYHIAPNHIESWTGRLLPFTTVQADGVTSSKHRFHPGQILYSKIRPYLAKAAMAPVAGVCSADMYPVESRIEPKFLLHWILTPWFTGETARNQGRTILPKINRDALYALPVPVAPANEQRQIAAKLDELFSDLDAGVVALERAQANLKRYRAAVLEAAVEGKLTEQWRAEHPDVEPASELLTCILKERRAKWEVDKLVEFERKGRTPPKDWREKYVEPTPPDTSGLPELPEGWYWSSVDQLSVVVRGASPRPAGDPKYFGGPVPWITVGSLTADELPYLHSVDSGLTEAGKDASRWIDPDTLLLTNSGATLGVPKITMIGGCINDGSVALLHVEYPLKLYLYYFLKTQTERLRALNQGAAQPNLNTGIVRSIAVPLCSQSEQDEITTRLAERLSQIEAAETVVVAGMVRSSRLRQSILRCAFEGKLVAENPTDEPASVLLGRIQEERGHARANGKPRIKVGSKPSRTTETI